MGIRNSNSQHSTSPINNSNPTMKSVIVLLVLVAVSQIDAFPRAIFYPGFRPGGNGAGFGTVTRDLSVRLRREWESQMLTTEDSHREAEAASVQPVHSDTTPVETGTASHSEDKYGRNCI